jgi:branched-chain amino acid transport system substrate-binding protein
VKERHMLRKIVPLSLAIAAAVIIPTIVGCAGAVPSEGPSPTPSPTPSPEPTPAPEPGQQIEGLSLDEMQILGHLPNQQIGVDYPIGETINIGFLAALSGPDAGWGLPGLTGNNIFIDAVNKTGGLLVGGVRYPLKMYEFDDEAVASKALQGARQLVLEHDVKFISAIGGNPADATHPFLTENKVVYASLISTDIKPDRPYLIAGGDVTPRIDMLRPLMVKTVLPRPEELGRPLRWAVTSQDDTIGLTCQAWEVGCAVAEGWDVVYDKHFSLETTDFAPVVTAMMATDPDAISLNLCYPTFQTLIWDQCYLQGYEGLISQNYIDWEANLQKIPPEYAAARWGMDSFPLMEDPWWGEPSWNHSFTRLWNEKYGPGGPEDVKRHMTGIDFDHVVALIPWCIGAQLAGEQNPGEWPDNDRILAALREASSFPTILGPGRMSGEDMWGIDNMITLPVPICKFDLAVGDKQIWTSVMFDDWFQNIKHIVIPIVEEHGQMYYQR